MFNTTCTTTPIIILCEDELLHTAENDFTCDDLTCPCQTSEHDDDLLSNILGNTAQEQDDDDLASYDEHLFL